MMAAIVGRHSLARRDDTTPPSVPDHGATVAIRQMSTMLLQPYLLRYLRFILSCLLLSLLIPVHPALAHDTDLVMSRAVLEDPDGNLDIDAVVHADFKASGPLLAAGFTRSVHWIRVVVRAPEEDEFELRIRPTYLDDVRLYEPDRQRPGAWIERVTGDRHYNENRPITALGFLLQSHGEPTTYYVRLKTSSSSLLNIEALELLPARRADLQNQFKLVVYVCIGLAMVLLIMNELIILRARLSLYFLIYLVTQLSQSVIIAGYLAHILPPHLVPLGDTINNVMLLCVIAAGTLFYRELFRTYRASPLVIRVLDVTLGLFFIELALVAMGRAEIALRLNGNVVFFIGMFLAIGALSMRGGQANERRLIKRILAVHALALAVTMLPLLGLLEPVTEWILNIGLVHGIITSSVMFAILHYRSRGLLLARKEVEMELALANRMLEEERRRNKEQAQFMDMLTHELKTPLAAAKMVLGLKEASENARRYAVCALDDMDAVVERCRQMDRLDQGAMTPELSICQVQDLLDEVLVKYGSPARVSVMSENLPSIVSDRHLLKIVLGNLVDNALKYSSADSEILINMRHVRRSENEHVAFTISNLPGSAGLPDPKRVFDKYYRAPHAYKHTGSGLGLYLVRNLTEMLSCRLTYQPGTTEVSFTLCIPV